MQVVITIEGSQADVFEQEPDELVQFSTDGEYTCVDGCGVRSATVPRWASAAGCWICCMSWILTMPAPTATS